MSAMKKGNKSKFISKELVNELANESQFLQKSPKARMQKRQRCEFETEEDDLSNLTVMYQTAKKKVIAGDECKESRQKLLIVMGHQLDARKQANINLLQNLSEVHTQLEADYNALKDNEQKLEHLVAVILKCLQQTTAAQKQILNSIKEIHDTFKKECEEMEMEHKAETDRLADELDDDMKKRQQKLICEAKRKVDNLRKTIFHVFENDL